LEKQFGLGIFNEHQNMIYLLLICLAGFFLFFGCFWLLIQQLNSAPIINDENDHAEWLAKCFEPARPNKLKIWFEGVKL